MKLNILDRTPHFRQLSLRRKDEIGYIFKLKITPSSIVTITMNSVKLLLLSLHLLLSTAVIPLSAQSDTALQIESDVTRTEVELNIRFLAADEFLGRDTGTQELNIAARYIATWFEMYGANPAEGQTSFYQDVPLQLLSPAEDIRFEVQDTTFTIARDLIAINEYRGDVSAPLIVLEYATEQELEEHDINGKIVISRAGMPGQMSPQQFFMSAAAKRARVTEAGALGLIEIYATPALPWQVLVNFLSGDRLQLDRNENEPEAMSELPHLWINGNPSGNIEFLSNLSDEVADLSVSGGGISTIVSRNVIGVIPGSDPDLRHEYVMLGAHYDHVGVMPNHPEPITSEFIFNGARDNAVGTAGIMAAARYFGQHPPRRSLILAAWTAEEKGLLGSLYYAENPIVPLHQTVYKLNIDGAGYNDTSKVTVIGLGRTEADEDLIAAAEAFGLTAIPDPVPQQNLFDRSDNASFARIGIPAPTYSMGLTAFDDEINYYYHQTSDHPDTLDYDYVTQYIRSFVYAAYRIAGTDEAPFWLPGDTYEQAGHELFGIGVEEN